VNAATRYGADGTGLGGLEGFFFRCCDLYGQTMVALLGRICPMREINEAAVNAATRYV
jgi:hypothetical protein